MLNRRSFLLQSLTGGIVLGMNAMTNRLSGKPKREKSPEIWVWMHPKEKWSSDEWRRAFGDLRKSGVGAVHLLVKNGDRAFYRSAHYKSSSPMLELALAAAKKEGVAVHAWIFTMLCTNPEIIKTHAEWFAINRNGVSCLEKPPYVGYYKWLCSTRPEVQEFVSKTIHELAEIDGLAGVHLDYIRLPDVILPKALQPKYDLVQDREFPEFDFCYCEVCRKTFQQKFGDDPLKLQDPASSNEWKQFRYDNISNIVNQSARIVRADGKAISAAVFATPDLARRYVRQDWTKWDLDKVFPMIYHNFYAQESGWIEEATREGRRAVGDGKEFFTGLYLPEISTENLQKAIHFARQGGANGVSLFDYETYVKKSYRLK